MSKSLGNILDPIEIINKYGIDQLRYYLVKEVSLGNDGSISLINLKNCINNDLANNYGNLCQRVFAFVEKNCANKIPTPLKFEQVDKDLSETIKKNVNHLIDLIDKQDLNTYIKQVVDFSFQTNKYFNDSKPWSLKESDPERMRTIIYTAIEQIKNISILLNPIMPIATDKILNILNIKKKDRNLININTKNSLNHDNKLNIKEILFRKIEDAN
jgi:methionyl-tRNA synthetase